MPVGATIDSVNLFENPGLTGQGLRVVLQELEGRQLEVKRIKLYNTGIDDEALLELSAWIRSGSVRPRPSEIHFGGVPSKPPT